MEPTVVKFANCANIVVTVEGKTRRLLSLREDRKGDLYIRVHGGVNKGIPPDHALVREVRYSIHQSPGSAQYTTVKRTHGVEGRPAFTTVALTDAVKAKRGYTLAGLEQFADPRHESFDHNSDGCAELSFGPVDPDKEFLLIGIILSALDTPPVPDAFNIETDNFRVSLLMQSARFPSTPFAFSYATQTFRPESRPGEEDRIRATLEGRTLQDCLGFLRVMVNEATQAYLREIQAFGRRFPPN